MRSDVLVGELDDPDAVLVVYQPGVDSSNRLFVMKPHRRPFIDLNITAAGHGVKEQAREKFDLEGYNQETTLAEFSVTGGGEVDNIAWKKEAE